MSRSVLKPHGCFLAGTDTDVGKTLVTAGLLRGFRTRGIDSVAIKPVQTGCLFEGDRPIVPDVVEYARAVDDLRPGGLEPESVYQFQPACSPHLAAREAGETICLDRIAEAVAAHQRRGTFTLVEGAGGLLVPMGGGQTMLDLIRRLRLPVVLVAANRLGTINHTLLSIAALREAGLEILGVVLNEVTPAADSDEAALRRDNTDAIGRYGDVPVLAELACFQEADFESPSSWAAVAQSLSPAVDRLVADRLIADCCVCSDGDSQDGAEEKARLVFDRDHLWHPYTSATEPLPVYEVADADGACLRLEDGRTLVDGMASWWCAIHGYRHTELDRAARDQLGRMAHVMFGGVTHRGAIELGRKLLRLAPDRLEHVFFADSGSVSVEVAIKMALQYWQTRGKREKTRLLTVRGGYHGDTFGAMSVCDPVGGMHHLFSKMLPQQIFVERPRCRFGEPFSDDSLDELKTAFARHADETAAVILEPIVQGAGGLWFYHPDYLKAVRELCDQHGVLLILDEIATGFGRTGRRFACQWADVEPDIMCLGKGLTGGYMTLAATLASRKVAHGISADGGVFMHGPTFMANPLACAVAGASLDLLERGDWQQQVPRIERWLRDGLEPCRGMDGVDDVRVLGAIGVIEMARAVDVPRLQAFFVERGVWIRPFHRWIYVMPPYLVSEEQVRRLTDVMVEAVSQKKYR